MDPRKLIALTLSLFLAGAFIVGCGVQTQDSPQILDPEQLPERLTEAEIAVGSSTTTVVPTPETIILYFVSGGRLARASRITTEEVTPTSVVDQLVRGTTPTEAALGLRTAIPSGVEVTEVEVNNGLATVNITGPFAEAPANEQVLAVAQLVYTLTELPGISGVLITLGGFPVAVPRADGTLTTSPLTRADYVSLAP